ncbi:hypothetical protein [Nodosilinea nodulosa]|uniref:hypothetical protein n=1 Tax=Nodosilinea nodulosa TaxID=416001 RepID=UPI0002FCF8A1|nr:hypothetical protein [Nodosilinea nodulosa]
MLNLPGPQFEAVVFDLNPPRGNLPPPSAAQGQRVPALFDWLEGPLGPGLAALRTSLATVLNPLPPLQQTPTQAWRGDRRSQPQQLDRLAPRALVL